MKFALLAAALAVSVMPAAAQDSAGRPLLRVYIDTPYFYEILATNIDTTDNQAIRLDLVVEGKEVGSSSIVYSCQNGDYSETVNQDWAGGADAFIPAALMAYAALAC